MAILLGDLKLRGSAVEPDDDTTLNIGGAIDLTKKPSFTDVNGLVQAVSGAAADAGNVTVTGRDASGTIKAETKALTGLTPVAFTTLFERLLKAVKAASTTGRVAVESQTATRTGTAQGGSADTITLDAGASAVNDAFKGQVIRITDAGGELNEIIKYVGATKLAHVATPWTMTPNSLSPFRIAPGFFFDKTPTEVLAIKRVFYAAFAAPPSGLTKTYYEKLFWKNTHASQDGTSAEASLAADPTGTVTFGLESVIDGTGTNGAGNNRQVAPGGIVFATTSVSVTNNGVLSAGKAVGLWLAFKREPGVVAINSSVTPRLTVQTF